MFPTTRRVPNELNLLRMDEDVVITFLRNMISEKVWQGLILRAHHDLWSYSARGGLLNGTGTAEGRLWSLNVEFRRSRRFLNSLQG